MSHCTFKGNIASIAGAILVLHLNTERHSQTVIDDDSVFDSNGSLQKCFRNDFEFIMFFDLMSTFLVPFDKKSLLSLPSK